MGHSEAALGGPLEDADGLPPVKDDNETVPHFIH